MEKETILYGLLITLVFITLLFGGSALSLYNQHIDLKTKIEAKQQANEVIFDNMWKTINQTVQVSDKYKDGLKEVLISYTNARSKGNNNLLMDWTKEAVPTFDSSIYKQVNNVIIGSRKDFTKNQELLLDMSRQHNQLIQKFPNNIFAHIMHIQAIQVQTVTSNKTNKAFKTGREDDIKL